MPDLAIEANHGLAGGVDWRVPDEREELLEDWLKHVKLGMVPKKLRQSRVTP